MSGVSAYYPSAPPRYWEHVLTPAQAAVLETLALGKSREEVAATHFIQPGTVAHHFSAIVRALKIEDRPKSARRVAAARWWFENVELRQYQEQIEARIQRIERDVGLRP